MEEKNKTNVEGYVDYLNEKRELQDLIGINFELKKLKESISVHLSGDTKQYITLFEGRKIVKEMDNDELNMNLVDGIIFTKDDITDFDTKIEENKIRMIGIIKNS